MNNSIGFYTLVRREIRRFMKVHIQTISPPIVSSLLYIIIFGIALGPELKDVYPVPYMHFIVPGLIMMGVITNAYANTSSSLYVSRWQNHIHEILVSPLSYVEMALAFVIGGVVRGIVVGMGIYLASLFFVPLGIEHVLLFIFFLIAASFIFSCLGVIIGLWAETFDHISILTTFVLTPLIFLGGVFHSTAVVPSFLKIVTVFNPLFYMVDGIRYSMMGLKEASVVLSVLIVLGLSIVLFAITIYLFKKGYKLRT